jgi:hypothetical protein
VGLLGLAGDLRRLFEQVYVVGGAKLPLAEAVETEGDARKQGPGAQFSLEIDDLNTDLNLAADRAPDVPVEEEEVQEPAQQVNGMLIALEL